MFDGLFEPKGPVSMVDLLREFVVVDAGPHSTEALAVVIGSDPSGVAGTVDRFNKRFASDGLRLVHIRGVGYRVATPADALHEATDGRALKLARQARRSSQAAVSAMNHSEATSDQRKRAADVAADSARLESSLRRRRRGFQRFSSDDAPVVHRF